jgi:hypothetical protein
MKPDAELTALAHQMFDCMRNVHMNLAKAEGTAAHRQMEEARRMHRQLFADTARHADICGALHVVLAERIDGLGAMVKALPPGK